jgi:hypothetical protein
MEFHLLCKTAIICGLLVGATGMAGASNKAILEAINAMERQFGLTTISTPILAIHNGGAAQQTRMRFCEQIKYQQSQA